MTSPATKANPESWASLFAAHLEVVKKRSTAALSATSYDALLVHTGTTWEDYFRYCEVVPVKAVDSINFHARGTDQEAATSAEAGLRIRRTQDKPSVTSASV